MANATRPHLSDSIDQLEALARKGKASHAAILHELGFRRPKGRARRLREAIESDTRPKAIPHGKRAPRRRRVDADGNGSRPAPEHVPCAPIEGSASVESAPQTHEKPACGEAFAVSTDRVGKSRKAFTCDSCGSAIPAGSAYVKHGYRFRDEDGRLQFVTERYHEGECAAAVLGASAAPEPAETEPAPVAEPVAAAAGMQW